MAGEVAVILVNLGTPEAPTPKAVRKYLREFLSDRRIVTMSPALWQPILNVIILPIRGRKSAAKYASIWTPQGSPLLVHAKAQVAALSSRLATYGVRVVFAMRYSEPSMGRVLDKLTADGIERALIVPMYPQYSTTTVASVFDALERYQASRADQPEYRTIRCWYDDPGYIDAAARRIEQTWAEHGRPDFVNGDKLLLSFHSIPVAAVRDGDSYPVECETTTRLLRARLNLDETECLTVYQSKFGPSPWLTPATIDTVTKLASSGTKRVDVFCPGFVTDCLETLEEIGILNCEAFTKNGGKQFVLVPCLNDFEPWADALAGIIRGRLVEWLGTGQ